MNDTANHRPMLAHAREAADEYLTSKVTDGSMTPEAAQDMAATGFTVTTRILADLRARDGLSEQAIVDAFEKRLDKARAAGDEQRITAAEFALAVWDGMRRDLADYLSGTGTGQR